MNNRLTELIQKHSYASTLLGIAIIIIFLSLFEEQFAFSLAIFWLIFLVLALIFTILHLFDPKRKKAEERKRAEENKRQKARRTMLVYEGSAGWLLFWFIVAPPIGYVLLILGMKNKVVER